MNESLVKYLAGLLDADGTIQFIYRPLSDGTFRLQVRLSLDAAESIDRLGFVKSLPELTGFGTVSHRNRSNPKHSPINTWNVCKRSDLEQLVPRLVKHMVIKAKHFDWCLAILRNTKGEKITSNVVEMLKVAIQQSRLNSGPLKPKNHPTWAWVAGYLDGDGYYSFRVDKRSNRRTKRCGACCHKSDRAAIDLLFKAFGGSIREEGDILRWYRSIGPRDIKFSEKFLSKLVQHSKLKKHKIETIIHDNRQRLTDKTPKGEVIV